MTINALQGNRLAFIVKSQRKSIDARSEAYRTTDVPSSRLELQESPSQSLTGLENHDPTSAFVVPRVQGISNKSLQAS